MSSPSSAPLRRWFGRDDVALYALVAVNVLIYAACAARSGDGQIGRRVLFDAGAIYPGVFARGEFWRLIAAGFLHLDLKHLLLNMLSLVIFGGPLIERVKVYSFAAIYLFSIILGNIFSILMHQGPFLSAGASGGISGLLGALVYLWAFGKIRVPFQFLFGNLLLNIAYSSTAANVDWMCHLGGFIGGVLACAVFDGVARLRARA